MLSTDYLIIGAGAASMAFIDTLLTEQPNAKLTVVDKHGAPGGHWNDAYGFVHLHQPSLLYGVASEQLEGNWLGVMLRHWQMPWAHRASKTEILTHYKMLMDKWVASGRVNYYPNSVYHFSQDKENQNNSNNVDVHTFSSCDGTATHQIQVEKKLVNGILGECIVPSQHPPKFPVDNTLQLQTPNQVFDSAKNKKSLKKQDKKYMVLGAGKTAMDTVVFLQRNMGIKPKDIYFVVPNDVWMIRRAGPALPESWPQALLKHNMDASKAALAMEKEGGFARLDSNVEPTKFRFPVVGDDELAYMRKAQVVRQGRVTSISREGDGAVVSFEKGNPMTVSAIDMIFVHCTSPGPFNGNADDQVFPSSDQINLQLLFAPPVPISMSITALLESRLQQGKLNMKAGRELLQCLDGNEACEKLTDSQVLGRLVRGLNLASDVLTAPHTSLDTLIVLATFYILLDEKPATALAWLKQNRLSTLSIPGNKSRMYETVAQLSEKATALGFAPHEENMLALLAEKLEPLKGM